MRIDIGSNSLRPEIMPNKTNSDTYEINSRGENIRGRVIDVNQNIVLIQTSNGKEFTANTTIPMENFIGQEMLFNVIFNSEGQMFLRPELNEKEISMMETLKIEDILIKLGKQLTPENKELAAKMLKAGIPLSPENFKELKELTLSLKILSQNLPAEYNEEQSKMPLQVLLKEVENSEKTQIHLKDRALNSSSLTSEKLLMEIESGKLQKNEVKTAKSNGQYIDSIKNKDSEYMTRLNPKQLTENDHIKDIVTIKLINQPVSLQNMKALNQITTLLSSPDLDITGFKDAMENIKKEYPDIEFSDEDVRSIIRNIESQIEKKIIPDNKTADKTLKEDLRIDYVKFEENLHKLISILSNKGDIKTKAFEEEVLPRINLLNEMEKHLNYNILSFNIDKYHNKAEYYLKKRSSSKEKQDQGTTVAFSINTYRIGNIKALLTQKSLDQIEVNISVENKLYKQKIDAGLPLLEAGLRSAGFKSITLNSRVNIINEEDPLNEIIYKNSENKSFETWV